MSMPILGVVMPADGIFDPRAQRTIKCGDGPTFHPSPPPSQHFPSRTHKARSSTSPPRPPSTDTLTR